MRQVEALLSLANDSTISVEAGIPLLGGSVTFDPEFGRCT
jgi:hypothetical protein